MSGIRQYQRRALEALKPEETQSIQISNTDKFYLNNKRIYLLGISEGIGTCSDLYGIYIAVFSFSKPENVRVPMGHQEVICSWSALLREPTKEEFRNRLKDKNDISYLVVELIEPILLAEKDDGKRIYYFKSTTKKNFYVNII